MNDRHIHQYYTYNGKIICNCGSVLVEERCEKHSWKCVFNPRTYYSDNNETDVKIVCSICGKEKEIGEE